MSIYSKYSPTSLGNSQNFAPTRAFNNTTIEIESPQSGLTQKTNETNPIDTLPINNNATYQPEKLVDNLFDIRDGLIFNEKWDEVRMFEARVLDYNQSNVNCEVLISSNPKTTQTRNFSSKLFNKFKELKKDSCFYIKISSKVGTIRIDLLPSNNPHSINKFKAEIDWETLKGFKQEKFDGK